MRRSLEPLPIPELLHCPRCLRQHMSVGGASEWSCSVASRLQARQVPTMGEYLNPFLIDGPALISVSGGRTSHYMLKRILDAHGGVLPPDVFVAFANTGKERPETLDFVRECAERWSVKIHWLEYRRPPREEITGLIHLPAVRDAVAVAAELGGTKKQQAKYRRQAIREAIRSPQASLNFREVSFYTASRRGEPFRELIRVRNFLPNPVSRFCTQELKIRVARNFMWSRGFKEWNAVLGIRADEPHRLAKLKANQYAYGGGGLVTVPLVRAGVDKPAIAGAWRCSPFDLRLKAWEGNCDLCFLKGWAKRVRIVRDHPELAEWWIGAEAEAVRRGVALNPRVAHFRKDTPSYARLLEHTREQTLLFTDEQLDPALEEDDALAACVGCMD